MTAVALLLIVASLLAFVAGQLLLKRAMEQLENSRWRNRAFLVWFVPGISAMTASFFLSLGLLQRFDLSYYFPFQGLSVIIVSVTAAWLLKETLTVRLMLGALLISGGIALVSVS